MKYYDRGSTVMLFNSIGVQDALAFTFMRAFFTEHFFLYKYALNRFRLIYARSRAVFFVHVFLNCAFTRRMTRASVQRWTVSVVPIQACYTPNVCSTHKRTMECNILSIWIVLVLCTAQGENARRVLPDGYFPIVPLRARTEQGIISGFRDGFSHDLALQPFVYVYV
jgi:hypothetical protein